MTRETLLALAAKVEAATGLSRVRLAELLYEHEGFVDRGQDNGPPDRDVPIWIEAEISANKHSGDCTKQPWSCMRCHADDALKQWDDLIAMMVRAACLVEGEGNG
ncbi:hypothetical protein [Novosphingobium sp. ZW T3_23]|uniref:hypothetical protein n=1 Tax=Novosphingobium sp. ZW T3_23 TaxID=3378084 RepID=UPI0038543F36